MDYNKIFEEIYTELAKVENKGVVAEYIPELSKIDPNKFGVQLTTVENDKFAFGDWDERFSIQSIAKVFSYVLAYSRIKSDLWDRVGVEPSGTAFNSLVQLENDKGIPRNPFINAGAIVVCDILVSELEKPKEDVLAFIRELSGIKDINFNSRVAESERLTGFINMALVNFMKSFGNIHNNIEEVMDLYFNLCSIEMNCMEVSKSFLFLANNGVVPYSGKRILSPSRTKRANALMQSCGFYDESGQFTFKVGLPGKSGVGGGIVAIHPQRYCITVWSPPLNPKGNSYKGMLFLEEFTTSTELSIF
ncbi:MAG TPA: glutaminase [Dysgonamonadaceae bacterium]|nr:glutaminase [Dysgonamonadaceae bacterium]